MGELDKVQERFRCLGKISRLLRSFQGDEQVIGDVFAALASIVPLRTAVLVERRHGQLHACRWHAPGVSAEAVAAAEAQVKAVHAYFEQAVASPPAAKQAVVYVTLPLTVHPPLIQGALLVEGRRPFDEIELTVIGTVADQLTVALDRHRAWQQAQDAIHARDALLTIVSHDLKNPLSIIILTTGYLLMKLPADAAGAKLRKRIEDMQRTAQRMHRMITELMDLESIAAGRLSIRPTDTDIAVQVRDAVHLQQPLAKAKSQTLSVEMAAAIPPVCCDADRIQQVLFNLIGNAIKYTPPGGAIIVRVKGVNGQVHVSVRDNGPGIPHDQIKRVFEPFWRGDTTTSGLGMGLGISKAIVEAHHNTIGVDSRPGAGSTFFFALPVAQAKQASAAAA